LLALFTVGGAGLDIRQTPSIDTITPGELGEGDLPLLA